MMTWWNGLTELNRILYGLALLVTVPFLWQLVAALLGLSHDGDVGDAASGADHDMGGGHDAAADTGGDATGDSAATMLAFELLSVRALLTFFTLFFWAAGLYLEQGRTLTRVFAAATGWGAAGMASVAVLLHFLPRLAHSGNRDLATALGSEATVYLDIPAGGTGEVRALVGGAVCHVKARTADGTAVKAGAAVRIRGRVGQTTLVVEPGSGT